MEAFWSQFREHLTLSLKTGPMRPPPEPSQSAKGFREAAATLFFVCLHNVVFVTTRNQQPARALDMGALKSCWPLDQEE